MFGSDCSGLFFTMERPSDMMRETENDNQADDV